MVEFGVYDPNRKKKGIEIKVVEDEKCPSCGASWGNPDPSLHFYNRPKVFEEDGTAWWRCYNPKCNVDYYEPYSGVCEGGNS